VLRAYGSTDKGPFRPTNEDCFGIDEHLGLCALADGMGGHNAGEVAARMAVDAVTDYVRVAILEEATRDDQMSWPFGFDPSLSRVGNVLRTAVMMAHVQILDTAMSVDRYSGMGTTMVVTLVRDGRLSAAHVGDSRLYLFGPRLRQLTRDDSWMVRVLAADSRGDRRLLQHHPLRNALTNAVGVGVRTDVHVIEEELRGDVRIALTTDGVHGVLDEESVEHQLADGAVQAASRNLVAAALAHGSLDNCTAVVADYRCT
jgi:protein phosphatase